jgi:hypothetical protein
VRPLWPLLLPVLVSANPLPTAVREIFEKAQCNTCHNDNGVASGTRFKFTGAGLAGSIEPLIVRSQPAQSRLIRMATNRLPHPGGERIQQGSREESTILAWIASAPLATNQPGQRLNAKQPVLRRLTHSQYNQTVADLLGDQTRPARHFPAEDFAFGYTNTAGAQSISPLLAEAYARAAARLALNANPSGWLRDNAPCPAPSPASTDCSRRFIRNFGTRAFRRPLTATEVSRFGALFDAEAKRAGDYYAGGQVVVEAMLQSPDFLFLSESGDYGIASRLSFLLWNTTPDADLLALAGAGGLHTRGQVEKAARRLLSDDRARPALDEFASQWLRFDRVRNAIRERKLFPEFGVELANAMIEETSRLFQHLVWNDLDFRDLFRVQYSFLNSSLAQLYGVPAPPREFERVDLLGGPRAGILGHASFLTMTSKPEETSPTERGLFIREHFLCQIVPPPPPGVDTTLPAIMEDRPMSNRERLSIHLSNAGCAGCHRLTDTVGFGLEQFDAIGRYREKQIALVFPRVDLVNKNVRREGKPVEIPVDTSASIVGLPDSAFTNAAQAGRILAESPVCQRCIVKQYFRFAMNRPETSADQPAIDEIFERFRRGGFRFRDLILSVVTSDPFLQEFVHAN